MRYNKLAINALGYVSCLSQSNFITEAICYWPWRVAVGLPVAQECIATFAAAGIQLAKVPGRPDVGTLKRLLHWLDVQPAGTLIAWGARWMYNQKPILFSLYQDLLRGKATEVDFINGQIVRLARACGLYAPRNSLAVEVCHELEQFGAASFLTREEVIERFQQVELPVAQAV